MSSFSAEAILTCPTWRLTVRRAQAVKAGALAPPKASSWNTWASALAFHNCRFPLAGGGHAKTIRSSRTDPAIMRLSVALRNFQKSFYYCAIAEMFGSIRCLDVC